jgi:protein SCO1/2
MRPGGRYLIGALAVLIVAAGAYAWRYGYQPARTLTGAVLATPLPAFDFHLRDQDGRSVSLDDLRGRPVALTFLYTHCPDVCPFIAEVMHRAYERLGDDAGRVAFVAVSVDPAGDTRASIERFLAAHRAVGQIEYLTGPVADLRRVWAHYYVGSDAREVNPAAVSAAPAAVQSIDHTAIVYLVDARGRIRAFLPGNLDAADLVHDLRVLLREAPRQPRAGR